MEFKKLIDEINEKKNQEMNKINDLILICDDIVKRNKSTIVCKLAEECKKRVGKILNFLKVEKYNLYFNGEVGVGKTTIISMLLGLVDEKANKMEKFALLPTASGRTTICETRIILGEEYLISFESVSEENFNDYLLDWADVNKNKLKKCDGSLELSSEISNWIIHTMGFKDKSDDKLKEFINDAKDSNELYDNSKKRIDYANRKQLNNEKFTAEKFFDCYKELNSGRDRKLKMPYKILLTIPIKNSNLNCVIDSIYDTKGIDSPARTDIRNNIALNDSISIMCDKIENFGSNTIIELLKPVLKPENKDYRYRVLLLGIDKGNQLLNVNDAEGNIEKGKLLKEEDAKTEFTKNYIGFNEKNFLFYNTLSDCCKTSDGAPNLNKIKEASKEFFKNIIDKSIMNMVVQYDIELSEIDIFLKRIKSGNFNDKFNKTIKELNDEIKNIYEKWRCCNNEELIWKNFEKELNNKKKISCASALRGAVNHNGCGYSANIYETMKDGASNFYTHIFNTSKDRIKEKLESVSSFNDEIEDACFAYIKNLILNDYYDECYFNYIDCVNTENERIMGCNNFWNKPKNYWGDGKGKYTERVHAFIKDGLGEIGNITYNDIIGKYDKRDETEFLYRYFNKIFSLLSFK